MMQIIGKKRVLIMVRICRGWKGKGDERIGIERLEGEMDIGSGEEENGRDREEGNGKREGERKKEEERGNEVRGKG